MRRIYVRTVFRLMSSLWIGSSSAPPRSGRIQPDQLRRLLLMIRPARPTLAEVPLADLSFLYVQDWNVAGRIMKLVRVR